MNIEIIDYNNNYNNKLCDNEKEVSWQKKQSNVLIS